MLSVIIPIILIYLYEKNIMKFFLTNLLLIFTLIVSAQESKTYTYAVKGLDSLKLDVYSPNTIEDTDSLPVLLWMHGGGFAGGSRAGYGEKKLAEYATSRGYLGISISYRLLRKGKKTGFGCNCSKEDKLFTFNQAVIDYLNATTFIYENSKMLKADPNKIIAGGSSAGAEAVLNAVYMKRYFLSDSTSYKNIKYAGVFSLAGAMVDIEYLNKENAVPAVLFHGTKDSAVPFKTDPHHFCDTTKKGYIILDGSQTIANKLDDLETSYYFNIKKKGTHDEANIPFDQLDIIFDFFDKTMLNNEIIQTKKIIY